MTLQTWGKPEVGRYYLRHAGRDLEVVSVPEIMNGETKRRYQVIVDGVFTDMAWSSTQAKTKAIKLAEKTTSKSEIIPYASRKVRTRSNKRSGQEENSQEVETMKGEANGASLEISAVEMFDDFGIDVHDPATYPEPQGTVNGVAPVEALANDRANAEPASTVAETPLPPHVDRFPASERSEIGEVSFILSGSFSLDDIDETNSLTTIRAAVELLREHGRVRCRVTVPSTIDL